MSGLPGAPCVAHACRLCCFQTEMLLLASDVARLESAGHDRAHFVSEEQGWLRLRNERGHCVFLGPQGCTVHESRPEGCRLYPLVWDEGTGRAVLDSAVCPFTREFEPRTEDRVALARLVDKLKKERAARPASG